MPYQCFQFILRLIRGLLARVTHSKATPIVRLTSTRDTIEQIYSIDVTTDFFHPTPLFFCPPSLMVDLRLIKLRCAQSSLSHYLTGSRS